MKNINGAQAASEIKVGSGLAVPRGPPLFIPPLLKPLEDGEVGAGGASLGSHHNLWSFIS